MTVTIDGNGFIAGLDDPLVVAHLNADQVIPDATFTTVIFNTEVVDSAGNYNPATGLFTASVAGWYQVGWIVSLVSSTYDSNANVLTALYRNGTSYRRGTQAIATLSMHASVGNALVLLAVGDTLSVRGYMDVTGTIVADGGQDTTAFDVKLVQRT